METTTDNARARERKGTGEILIVGSLNMDLVVQADRMPSAGETVLGTSFVTVPGGKGGNQAVAAARLGGRVTMIGCVGQDSFGEQLIEGLRVSGVDVQGVRRTANATTGVAAVLVDREGENRIIAVPAANGQLSPADVASLEARFAEAELIVTQLEVPRATVKAAIALAARHRVPVLFNPAPAFALENELLAGIDYLVLNETEASVLTGVNPDGEDTCRQAALALRACGVGVVVLTLGARGAYVYSDGEGTHVPAQPVTVVDTTAAGDSFVGGMAVSLVEGRGIVEATRFACAAGTLAVTRLGAQTSIPTRDEVETMLARVQVAEPPAERLLRRGEAMGKRRGSA